MADYCTVANVKTYLPESGLASSSDYDDMLTDIVTNASRAIDNTLGKWPNYFYPSAVAETRYYDGNDECELLIDECVSLTSVSVAESGSIDTAGDYTLWAATDYTVEPYNYTALSVPIIILSINTYDGTKDAWYKYPKAVKVIGIFGYSTTPPPDVKMAAIIQSVRWFMRAKQAFQSTGGGSAAGSVTFDKLDDDVAAILARYGKGRLT